MEDGRWKLKEAEHNLPASSFAAATAGQEGPAKKSDEWRVTRRR
jgi:hypothetical protein